MPLQDPRKPKEPKATPGPQGAQSLSLVNIADPRVAIDAIASQAASVSYEVGRKAVPHIRNAASAGLMTGLSAGTNEHTDPFKGLQVEAGADFFKFAPVNMKAIAGSTSP